MEAEINTQNNLPGFAGEGENMKDKLMKYKWVLVGAGGVLTFIVFLIVISASSSSPPTETDRGEDGVVPTAAVVEITPTPTLTVEMRAAVDEAKQSAQEYMDLQTELRTDYPWLRRLPLATEKYFVYFDLQKGKFIGEIHFQEGDDIEQLKARAISALQVEKGIPADSFEFEWTVNR